MQSQVGSDATLSKDTNSNPSAVQGAEGPTGKVLKYYSGALSWGLLSAHQPSAFVDREGEFSFSACWEVKIHAFSQKLWAECTSKKQLRTGGANALWRASFSINNLFRRIIKRPLEEIQHIIEAEMGNHASRAVSSEGSVFGCHDKKTAARTQAGGTEIFKGYFMAILRGKASKRRKSKSSL